MLRNKKIMKDDGWCFVHKYWNQKKSIGEPGPCFATLYNYAYSYYFDIHEVIYCTEYLGMNEPNCIALYLLPVIALTLVYRRGDYHPP